ncbi:MAG: protease complex subunit PrcB family protein [Elusimicrobia bacterium]|nr:protease complex subunit PrcB family protein [Elusimicrobiota bacterium]
MECKETRRNISLYIDGQLSGSGLAGFEVHISECSNCAKILKETKLAIKAVSDISGKQLPDGFYERLNKRLDKTTVLKPVSGWNYLMRGVATALTLLIAFFLVKEIRKQQPVPESDIVPLRKQEGMVASEKEIRQESGINEGEIRRKIISRKSKSLPRQYDSKKIVKRVDKISDEYSKGNISKSVLPLKEDVDRRTLDKLEIVKGKKRVIISDGKELLVGFDENKILAEEIAKLKMETKRQIIELEESVSGPREWYGYHSGYTGSGTKVFKDKNSWMAFRQKHERTNVPSSDLADIDFSKEMIIAAFMGQKPTGGYSVRIVDVEKLKDKIVVKYREEIPGKDSISTQAFTQPYHIKVIEKSTLPIIFKKLD